MTPFESTSRAVLVSTQIADPCCFAFAYGVPTALGALSLQLARRVLDRKAPGALATVAAKMTGTTREAVLLARIKTEQSG